MGRGWLRLALWGGLIIRLGSYFLNGDWSGNWVKVCETRREYVLVGSSPASMPVMVSHTFTQFPLTCCVFFEWLKSKSDLVVQDLSLLLFHLVFSLENGNTKNEKQRTLILCSINFSCYFLCF